ncbi:MAG TPA: transposase [Fimbriimonas sp.]|nr:transposase [Fimbriimonas sp.]
MPQSLSQVVLHATFSTRDRTPWLDEELRPSVFAYLASVLHSQRHVPILIGGHEDHVHLLFGLSRTVSIADTIKHTKVASSLWMKSEFAHRKDFAWQNGYGVFAVAYPTIDSVKEYISNQDDHHRKLSFQDEFRRFMHENGISFDERYVWD